MRMTRAFPMVPVSILGLFALPVHAAGTGTYDYDSRRLYDLCSPDQIATSQDVNIEWGHYRQWQTVNGRVGVVRLSSAFRYPLGDFRPQRALANDRETVALWRLEEQDGAGRYQDASGNGHHLYIADGLLVPHVETLGALWSWVKMGSRP